MKKVNAESGHRHSLLFFALVFCLLLSLAGNAYAIVSRTQNFRKTYTLTGSAAEDIVRVAEAQVGLTDSTFGYNDKWCAFFVCDCARLANISASVVPWDRSDSGSSTQLYNHLINECGASVVSSPQRGDIVFYRCSVCGIVHVGLYSGSGYYTEGNVGGKVLKYNTHFNDSNGHSSSGAISRIYVRPQYVTVPAPSYVTVSAPTATIWTVGQHGLTYTLSSDRECTFYIHVGKNGTEIYTQQLTGKSITYIFESAGTYSVWFGAVNAGGSAVSQTYNYQVYEAAGKPVSLYHNSSAHTELDEWEFRWGSAANAAYYTVQAYRDDNTGGFITGKITSPLVARGHFRAGTWKVRVIACNAADSSTSGDIMTITVGSAETPEAGTRVMNFEHYHKLYSLFEREDNRVTWLEARAIAEASGGAFATIPDAATQQAAAAAVAAYGKPVWIGGQTVDDNTCFWHWQKGPAFASGTYTNWAAGCPASDRAGFYNYIYMGTDGKWYDADNGGWKGSSSTYIKTYMLEFTPTAVEATVLKESFTPGTQLTKDDLCVTVTFSDGFEYEVQNYTFECSGTEEGEQAVTVAYGDLSTETTVNFAEPVPEADLDLPDDLTRIEDQAFMGGAFKVVYIPDGCTYVGHQAFMNCEELEYISYPAGTVFEEDAFEGCGEVRKVERE